MLDNNAIEKIPIENFVIPHRTLVAIWCTNAPSAIKSIKERFLSKWKLKLISTWYWIKVITILDKSIYLLITPSTFSLNYYSYFFR